MQGLPEGFFAGLEFACADQMFISEGNPDGVHLYLSHECRG
jgi:hypothetical protein